MLVEVGEESGFLFDCGRSGITDGILPAAIKVVSHLDDILFLSLLLSSDALFPTILT